MIAIIYWVSALLLLFLISAIYVAWRNNDKSFHKIYIPRKETVIAPKSQTAVSITLSAWASALGSWLLFAPGESGFDAGYWGLIAYGTANLIPFLYFAFLGPIFVERCKGYSLMDYVKERIGFSVYIIGMCLTLLFMFIIVCAELTGLVSAVVILQGTSSYPTWITPLMVIVTAAIYTSVGGLVTSIFTDKIQTGIILVAVTVILILVLPKSYPDGGDKVLEKQWESSEASWATIPVLLLGTSINEFLNQTQWQRVWAAKSQKDLLLANTIAGSLICITVVMFGLIGVYTRGRYAEGSIPDFDADNDAGICLFYQIKRIGQSQILTVVPIIMTTCLSLSTVDSVMNAFTSLWVSTFEKKKINFIYLHCINLLFLLPTIAVAVMNYSVLNLFLVSNLLSLTWTPGIIWSLIPQCASAISINTSSAISFISIIVMGAVFGLRNPLRMFMLPHGPYAWQTAVAFTVVPFLSASLTPIIAYIEKKFKGEQHNILVRSVSDTVQDLSRENCRRRSTTADSIMVPMLVYGTSKECANKEEQSTK